MSLAQRLREPEDIDDPDLDPALLRGALQGLETINVLSASPAIVWRPIAQLARRLSVDRLRVLDVATGAGDVPLALWRKCRRAGLKLELHGVDINEIALDFARERAQASGAAIKFTRHDALADALPGDYDVVMCSLFLHHLDEAPAVKILASMAQATNHLVLVSDLRRHWWGLTLAHVAGRLLTRSPIVRLDAIRSVRGAFTMSEARELANQAGLTNASIHRRWPCRFLLSWQKPRED